MLETDQIPEMLRKFYVAPLDKPGKDPTRCDGKRPIALLSPLMKLLEMILVRRMLPGLEGSLSGGQYAYQQGRSTELLLGDLDSFVEEGKSNNWHTYVLGLDIQGAFDCASLTKLADSLKEYGIPEILRRFIGNWLTGRSFRIKLGTTDGVAYSRPRTPSRGVPQGGVLSPLLWILHVNKVIAETQKTMEESIGLPKAEWRLIVQLFADDISAAVSHKDRRNWPRNWPRH